MSRLNALGEMASALAHELNQPLAAIANYIKGVRRLSRNSSGDNAGRFATAIDRPPIRRSAPGRSSAGCAISSRGARASAARKRAGELVEEASALALVGAKDKGIRVRFAFAPAVDFVLADKVQVQQVLLNLMRNAIEAMQDTPTRDLVIARLRRRRHDRDQRRRHRAGIAPESAAPNCSSRS